jgi:hypothetical protein
MVGYIATANPQCINQGFDRTTSFVKIYIVCKYQVIKVYHQHG